MSRAFVNEDTPSFDELPDRVIPDRPNDVTPEGLAQIEAQLADARRTYGAAQEADDRHRCARRLRRERACDGRTCQQNQHIAPSHWTTSSTGKNDDAS